MIDAEIELNCIGRDDFRCCLFSETYCGGYSGEDPPLPIPNREVKLTIADGTAPPGGRVGSCHFLIRHPVIIDDGVFCCMLSFRECAESCCRQHQPFVCFDIDCGDDCSDSESVTKSACHPLPRTQRMQGVDSYHDSLHLHSAADTVWGIYCHPLPSLWYPASSRRKTSLFFCKNHCFPDPTSLRSRAGWPAIGWRIPATVWGTRIGHVHCLPVLVMHSFFRAQDGSVSLHFYNLCKVLMHTMLRHACRIPDQKSCKKVIKIFGSKEKSRTFALPFEKRVSRQDETQQEVHWKDCFTVQEASTEKYNLSRSVNSFERIISVRTS